MTTRILHLEDDPADAELVRETLAATGLAAEVEVAWVDNRSDYVAALREVPPDLILLDFNLPTFDGVAALALAREGCPEVPVIIVSGTIGEERATEVLRSGATDYVLKSRLDKLPHAVRRALAELEEHRRIRAAEHELRLSERRYRRLIEELPGVFFTGRFGPDGGHVGFVSPQVEALLGFAPNEWMARPELWMDSLHPDDRSRVFEAIAQCTREGAAVEIEHRMRHRAGRLVWVRARIQPEGPGSTELRGIVTDVTEQRLVLDQLLQAQKMEALGRLAGGVAHDFNNLLTVINGFSELVLASVAPGDAIRPDVQEILAAGQRASGLTRQLLAFSRKHITEATTVDLNGLIANVRKMLERVVGADVTIAVGLADQPLPCAADPGQLEQVVLNLVINARDAMPDGGRLTISTAAVDLDVAYARTHTDAHPGPYVAVSVADTGTGMTDDVRRHLFEPFFTTKEQGKGTGLGLATVHGIVKRADGVIEVESELGRGSTFRILLPRVGAVTAPAALPGPPTAGAARGTETVLVADDQAIVLRLARTVLATAGYTVLAAGDGTEALRIAEAHAAPIHLLLTDIVMRSVSGPDLAHFLRKTHPETRVLYMSGRMDRVPGEPGTAFLPKPFTLDALKTKVRAVLDAPAKVRG